MTVALPLESAASLPFDQVIELGAGADGGEALVWDQRSAG
jgi:hypothetical protein